MKHAARAHEKAGGIAAAGLVSVERVEEGYSAAAETAPSPSFWATPRP